MSVRFLLPYSPALEKYSEDDNGDPIIETFVKFLVFPVDHKCQQDPVNRLEVITQVDGERRYLVQRFE
jgi:hypothetical protein